jgi:hypothetical protein
MYTLCFTTLLQSQIIWSIVSRLEAGYSQMSNLAWEKSGTPVWVMVKHFFKIRLSFLMHLAFCPLVSTSRLSGALYYERYEHFEKHVNSYRESDKNTGHVMRRLRRSSAVIPTATCVWLTLCLSEKNLKESEQKRKKNFLHYRFP